MRISGFDDPDSSGWDALHRGTEREGFDSPSKFDMSTLSMIMPKRKPARPQPDAQGYTDEDTREWGSSAADEEYYDPAEPEWQDEERYAPEPPPLEPAWTPPRGARPPAPPRPAPRTPAPSWAPPVAPQAGWTPPPDPETRWIPQPEAWEEPARVAAPAPVASVGSRVRPYTRTGGRTRSEHNLALEALVSTSDDGRRYRGVRSVEHRRICDLCLDTRSVAEIAAHLRLPLGVVKVLVGDMSDIGLVLIHHTELILGDRSSRDFMERVLAGLRAL